MTDRYNTVIPTHFIAVLPFLAMKRYVVVLIVIGLLPVVGADSLYVIMEDDDDRRQFTVQGDYSIAVNESGVSFVMSPSYVFDDQRFTYTNVSALSAGLVLANGSVRHRQVAMRDTQIQPNGSVSASFRVPIDRPTDEIEGLRFGINHTAVGPDLGKFYAMREVSELRWYVETPGLTIGSNMSAVNRGEPVYLNGTTDADGFYMAGESFSVNNGTFGGWVSTESLPVIDQPPVRVYTYGGAIVDRSLPVRIEPRKPDVVLDVPATVKEGEQMTITVESSKAVQNLELRWLDWELSASDAGSFIVPTENASTGLYRLSVEVTDADGVTVEESAGFEIVDPDRYDDEGAGDQNTSNASTEDDSDQDDEQQEDEQDRSGGLPFVRGFRTFVEGVIERLFGIGGE